MGTGMETRILMSPRESLSGLTTGVLSSVGTSLVHTRLFSRFVFNHGREPVPPPHPRCSAHFSPSFLGP
jgi:hypothetical protein